MRGPPARHPDDDAREQLPAPEGIIESADELRAGDRVVYPNQGVCAIVGWEVKEIAGQKLDAYAGQIAKLGLTPVPDHAFTDQAKQGVLFATDPPGGTRLPLT